jgi:hypothetical protein
VCKLHYTKYVSRWDQHRPKECCAVEHPSGDLAPTKAALHACPSRCLNVFRQLYKELGFEFADPEEPRWCRTCRDAFDKKYAWYSPFYIAPKRRATKQAAIVLGKRKHSAVDLSAEKIRALVKQFVDNNAVSGQFRLFGKRGKPKVFMHVPQATVSDSEAKAATKRHRLRQDKKMLTATHARRTDSKEVQQADVAKAARKLHMYVKTSSTVFTASARETLQLQSTGMTGKQLRLIRTWFNDVFEGEVKLASDKKTRQYAQTNCSHDLNIDSFLLPQDTHGVNPNVTHAVIKDVKAALQKVLQAMYDGGELFHREGMPSKTIYVKLMGDKGGNSTKLALSVVNVEKPNSTSAAFTIGVYDNGAEDWQSIRDIFGGVLAQCAELKSVTIQLRKKALPVPSCAAKASGLPGADASFRVDAIQVSRCSHPHQARD